jgi:tRNA(Ile)-lysidine synthase
MVLLDLLVRQQDLELVIAHYDHGIRADSSEDRKLVASVAAHHGLPFFYAEGVLGSGASEATARSARYAFLERIKDEQQAVAIILAHHQDDVLETAILNMLRGTGRRGLSSLTSTPARMRPLLGVSKADLVAYAIHHKLVWHEDSTNSDERYLRNYIRHRILPRFDPASRKQLAEMVSRAAQINRDIDDLLEKELRRLSSGGTMDRRQFILLPHNVSKEVLAAWLRQHRIRSYDTKLLERVTIAVKVQRPGSRISVVGGAVIDVGNEVLALHIPER